MAVCTVSWLCCLNSMGMTVMVRRWGCVFVCVHMCVYACICAYMALCICGGKAVCASCLLGCLGSNISHLYSYSTWTPFMPWRIC